MPDRIPWLIISLGSPGYYGLGQTMDEAKRNFRKQGGRLSDGYRSYWFGDSIRFDYVDGFGAVHWVTADGSDYDRTNSAHQPVVHQHEPRRNR